MSHFLVLERLPQLGKTTKFGPESLFVFLRKRVCSLCRCIAVGVSTERNPDPIAPVVPLWQHEKFVHGYKFFGSHQETLDPSRIAIVSCKQLDAVALIRLASKAFLGC